jgi:mannose-6-phosphate isomerase-like protein (cupin superfamily)
MSAASLKIKPGMAPQAVASDGPSPLVLSELERLTSRIARKLRRLPRLPHDPTTTEPSGRRLVVKPDYDVWLLRWTEGSRVTPHDHGLSAGCFAVAEGELVELRWKAGLSDSRKICKGESCRIPRGAVHDIISPAGAAVSIHVYSPPLVEMRYYDRHGLSVLRADAVCDPGLLHGSLARLLTGR